MIKVTTWLCSSVHFISAHLVPSANEASYGFISSGPLILQSFSSNLPCMHHMLKIPNAALLHSKSGMCGFWDVLQLLVDIFFQQVLRESDLINLIMYWLLGNQLASSCCVVAVDRWSSPSVDLWWQFCLRIELSLNHNHLLLQSVQACGQEIYAIM